ncbi:XRE family transcriptional regulator [Clostridium botulinum]|uniref:Helix-turn-helix transcriptional regulator n=2 Tax=Companilactobacillus TaxID=2767879 RepID=A0A5P0ZS83_9LACO|nr:MULTISPECIES: helix-turn-helix transcriptional regulator [Bacillota]MCS6109013.1 XRE family transcriptional regulator [Clostridium botulinum]MQS77086.1 helix-turn-helix transcriptional regulator [Companilactobacillus halodurans]MQS98584.1 helix-turn-helix transcriptional regulator [Companilactobacillus halodurans]PMD68411.1 transcriptional regulator [Companilactobacillus nuruki]
MENIGIILKKLRMIYGDTAKDFSGKINISPSYLSEIETGKKSPSLEILNNYAEILGLKVSTLILLAEDKKQINNDLQAKKLIKPLMEKVISLMAR